MTVVPGAEPPLPRGPADLAPTPDDVRVFARVEAREGA
jgi:hypothetical protein